MTPENLEIIKIVLSSISGGVLVKAIDWLANRGKNKADEIKTLQDFWHDEFERLEKEVKELRGDIKGRDATIEEITTKYQEITTNYRELQTDYQKLQRLLQSRDKKICEQDGIIQSLSNRIKELEDLMRKYGIDPDKGKEA